MNKHYGQDAQEFFALAAIADLLDEQQLQREEDSMPATMTAAIWPFAPPARTRNRAERRAAMRQEKR